MNSKSAEVPPPSPTKLAMKDTRDIQPFGSPEGPKCEAIRSGNSDQIDHTRTVNNSATHNASTCGMLS